MGLEQKVAIIRLEQIGPFPYTHFTEVIKDYNKNAQINFFQEEHYNFGAFTYVRPRINIILEEQGFQPIQYKGRRISAVSSTGFSFMHKEQHAEILNSAFK